MLPAWISRRGVLPASRLAVVALLLSAAGGCAHPDRSKGGSGATFVVVRHAEKMQGDDPALTAAGRERARVLAESLRDQPLRAAYATGYLRTQETAAPSAAMHGLDVLTYDAKESASVFARRLLDHHAEGTVLVVGHSNTVADIAAALCGCTVAPLGDDEYDRRIRIRVHAGGASRTTLEQERY